ncbi:MAG: hypothetical protein ACLTH0_00580 [Blautia producta]
MDIRNKKLSDDEFYGIRKEIMGQWPTGKDVDFDEAIEYHKVCRSQKVFPKLSRQRKKEKH